MADLLLADLSGLFWRAWHATANQERGSAFETTLGMIAREASNHTKTAIAVDSPPYRRVTYYPQYKAQRQKPEPEAVDQLRRLKLAVAEKYFVLEQDGLEADDMIASAVAAVWKEGVGCSVTILSSDKDMLQLVNDHHHIEVKSPNGLYDELAVEKFSGVRPEHMHGWLALCGDRVDNVPGVKGIGKVRACEILKELGGIDRIIDLIQVGDPGNELGKHREKLLASKEDIIVSTMLTKLIEVPVDLAKIDQFVPRPARKAPLDGWYEEHAVPVYDTDPVGPDSFGGEDYPAPEGPDPFRFGDLPSKPESEPEEVHSPPARAVSDTERPQPAVSDTERPPPAPPSPPTPPASQKPATVPMVHRPPKRELDIACLEPRTNSEARQIATYLFDAGVFNLPNESTALAMIMAGRQWGMGAVQAVMAFHVMEVEGRKRLTLAADTIIGRVQASRACEYIYPKRSTETESVYVAKRVGYPEPVELVYSIEDAKLAGLVKLTRKGNPGMWMMHPRSMLSKTCAVHLCRALFRDIMSGVYATEEFPDD